MSTEAIPDIVGKDQRLMLIYPAVAHGYLFHITGEVWLAVITVFSVILPAYDFSIFYYHGVEESKENAGWFPRRVALIGSLLYIPLAVLHILAICLLAWQMDYTDYILVTLLFFGVFLAAVVIIGVVLNRFVAQV